ncbi:pre-RNA processing PIH1/Nop17-domain-containing protein, partial [Parasitella parasitica]
MPTLEAIEDDDNGSPFLIGPKKSTPDIDQLTEEEKNALFDQIASQVAADPFAFQRLAKTFLDQTTKQDFGTVNIQPQAGYVCKTHVDESASQIYKVGTAVYINVCYHSAIPAPPITTEAEIQKALNATMDAVYRVPLSLGQIRYDDKGSLVLDACINTQPYLRSEKDLDFRLYILELSIEFVESLIKNPLSREFTMPNTKCIGQIPVRVLRLPKPSLITAIQTEINPQTRWQLKPQYTVNQAKGLLVVVIEMPNNNFASWTLDITINKILLKISNSLHTIPLKQHEIKVDHEENKVNFYQKSLELVLELKLASKNRYI